MSRRYIVFQSRQRVSPRNAIWITYELTLFTAVMESWCQRVHVDCIGTGAWLASRAGRSVAPLTARERPEHFAAIRKRLAIPVTRQSSFTPVRDAPTPAAAAADRKSALDSRVIVSKDA
jgi:hypothetical protein